MVDAPYPPAHARDVPAERPWLGYALVWAAVAVWSVNAAVMKVVLESADVSAFRLSELRATGSTLLLFAAVALLRPARLRVSRRELPFLACFGLFGLAFAQFFYLAAIERLEIGIALVVIYLSPIFVALWARFVMHEPVRSRLWAAIGLSIAGLSLVVDLWGGVTLNMVGLAACLVTALGFAVYVLMADAALRRGRDAYSLLAWGFLFAALFWALAQPWWTFPGGLVAGDVSLLGRLDGLEAPVWLLVAYVVVLGTLVPFALLVTALHHIAPTRVAIVAMLEPVGAALVAFAWLGEELSRQELAGAALVLAGVALAQTARSGSG